MKIKFNNLTDIHTGKKLEIVTSKINRAELLRTRKAAKKSAEWFLKNFGKV